jgi:hypothetical protein
MRRRAAVTGALFGAAAVVVAVVVLSNGSSVRVLPDPRFSLPVKTSGCNGVATLADGARVVPITVRHAGSEAVMFADVCVDGKGPFPFIIDTGAAATVIDLDVAERFHLPKIGAPVRSFGVGCSLTTQNERLTDWSVGGLPLAGQVVAVQTVAGMGAPGEPDGLLGAGTLSRFGAVRFDFAAQTMTVAGPEEPPVTARRQMTGPLAPIPEALLGGSPSGIAGLTVVEGSTYTIAAASVHFRGGNGGVFLVVDTGSSRSVVDTSVTRVVSLVGTDVAERQSTVCSSITMPLVRSGPWSVSKVPLVPLVIGSTDLGQLANSGVLGLLGLDELSRYQYVVIDFKDAVLALGPLQN